MFWNGFDLKIIPIQAHYFIRETILINISLRTILFLDGKLYKFIILEEFNFIHAIKNIVFIWINEI